MQELAVREPATPSFSMTPRNLDEAMQFAKIMADSDLVPKDFKGKPGNILVAIQKGLEIGLSPMSALESIAVINGRASLWGDGMLALVQASPVYEWHDESQSTPQKGVCIIKRKGHPEHRSEFSLEDAKRAGLLGKPGPWTQYTARMLTLRARAFALRDKFADALKGLPMAEEAMDLPAREPITAEVAPTPPSSLKDRLRAQLEPPAEVVESVEEPTATDLGPDDTMIVFNDLALEIQAAETVKRASEIFNEAVDKGQLPKVKIDALKVVMQERLGQLAKKK
ncbi:MAG: hypothetical protein JFAIHJKO_02789 [Pyrinomonadaceae bacterium]|nr:hypothetical protein [Pyrinomonadaceae bacterium]